jgi:hypothetical protein
MIATTALSVWLVTAAICREASDQPTEGQIAVAQVVATRSIKWKKPINKIINRQNFPWGGMKHKMPEIRNRIDLDVHNKADAIARAVLFKGLRSKRLARGDYTFFNHYKLGRRFKTDVPLVRIGQHVFY